MTKPIYQLAGLGVVLAALMIGACAFHLPGSDWMGSATRFNSFVGVLAVGVGVYLLAARLVLRKPLPPAALWLVLGVAVAMRLALLPQSPFLSSDVYRYVWDGKVQAAGINPYLHVPADPALAHLRDDDIYPLITRKDYAITIYQPAAQAVFGLVGWLGGRVLLMKVAMLAFEAAAIAAMLAILGLAGLPRARILIYAWNPLPLWSFALDGHVDAIAVGLVGLALLARARRRDGVAGGLLAAAVLVKVLPVVVAPAFLRGGRFWRPALIGIAVIAALYLPYLSAGWNVFGFVPTYSAEEGFDHGTGYWLVAGLSRLVALPDSAGRVYGICAALGFAALALWIWRRRDDTAPDAVALCRDAAILAGFATAAANPHYAWYYAWLALPCSVAPVPAVIWLSSASVLFYIDPFNERFFWPGLVFGPALALAAWDVWRRRALSYRPAAA